MAVNWGILANAPDPGNAFAQGFQNGQQQRRQYQAQNALAAYAKNPDDPNAAHSLIAVDPRLGLQVMQDQRERAKQAQIQALTQRAVGGDHTALEALAGLDPDLWTKIDGHTRERVKQSTQFLGNAVLEISRLPEAARPQAWDNYVQQAHAAGMDIPPQYERYSPQALNAAAAEAGTMEKLLQQFEPKYQVAPAGGGLINTNPLSPGFNPGATANVPPEGFDTLPPGYAPAGGAGSGPHHFP